MAERTENGDGEAPGLHKPDAQGTEGTLPVGLTIANNLQEFFVHAVLSPDS